MDLINSKLATPIIHFSSYYSKGVMNEEVSVDFSKLYSKVACGLVFVCLMSLSEL